MEKAERNTHFTHVKQYQEYISNKDASAVILYSKSKSLYTKSPGRNPLSAMKSTVFKASMGKDASNGRMKIRELMIASYPLWIVDTVMPNQQSSKFGNIDKRWLDEAILTADALVENNNLENKNYITNELRQIIQSVGAGEGTRKVIKDIMDFKGISGKDVSSFNQDQKLWIRDRISEYFCERYGDCPVALKFIQKEFQKFSSARNIEEIIAWISKDIMRCNMAYINVSLDDWYKRSLLEDGIDKFGKDRNGSQRLILDQKDRALFLQSITKLGVISSIPDGFYIVTEDTFQFFKTDPVGLWFKVLDEHQLLGTQTESLSAAMLREPNIDTNSRPANDDRGNPIAATQLESSWAVGVMGAQTWPQIQIVLAHLTTLADVLDINNYRAYSGEPSSWALIRNYLSSKSCRLEHIGDLAPHMRSSVEFIKHDYAKRTRSQGEPYGRTMFEFAVRNDDFFKIALDRVEQIVKVQRPDIYEEGRGASREFQDRGRIMLDPVKDLDLLNKSFRDVHAGIVQSDFMRGSTRNIFTKERLHAKGFARIDDKPGGTGARFRAAGAPFIAGASGGISAIALSLEFTKRIANLSTTEIDERESLLGNYFAMLVCGGHHSVSECLIAAQAYGYFANVPHPLVDYKGAMKGLQQRLESLGTKAGDKVLY